MYERIFPTAAVVMTRADDAPGVEDVLACLGHDGGRAVTVFGPAGAGKSSLVRSAARASARPAVVVDCARAADPADDLWHGLAAAVSDVLVVLDDLEHLDSERRSYLGRAVEDVGLTFPTVQLLVTDSRPGRLPGAVQMPVGRLAVPVDHTVTDLDGLADSPSVSAFTAAMRHVRPGFALDARNHADIADICAAVHGVPGHLVLAARIAGAEGLDTVARTLAPTGWDDGMAALAVLACRHAERADRTGLDPGQRRVLAAALLCPDGFRTEAVRRMTGLQNVDAVLERLVDVGLIEVLEERSGTLGAGRRYHIPLPALAAVRPDTADCRALGGAHSDYYLRLAEIRAAELWTPRQAGALLALRRERRNIAAALGWAVGNGHAGRAVALVTALAPYWRRLAELPTLRSWVVELIGCQAELTPAETHRVNVLAAEVFARLGEHEAALDAVGAAEQAAASVRVGEGAAADQVYATGLAWHATAASRAAEQLRRAAAQYHAIGDEAGAVAAEFDLSAAEFGLGRVQDADRTARAALAGATRRGDELTGAALLLRLAAFAAAGEDPRAGDGPATPGSAAVYVERAMVKLRGLGAAAAVGVLACQVDTFFERSVVRQATDLARLLGSFTAHHRADFRDASPDFAVGDRERRLRDLLGERVLGEAAASGTRVPLHELFAEIAARTLGSAAAEKAAAPRTSLLTRRETEVALLVGEGLTNREVARRLAISEWTVVNHMRQIMRKLGFTSRVQLARWTAAAL